MYTRLGEIMDNNENELAWKEQDELNKELVKINKQIVTNITLNANTWKEQTKMNDNNITSHVLLLILFILSVIISLFK